MNVLHMIIKRIFDVLISFILLVVFSPIFLIIAILVKLDSSGPVLFVQKRLTKDKKVFSMFKFRTMVVASEKTGTGLFTFKNDGRITRVGKYLRKTSVDELPQLINILIGQMSFVGPRPPVTYELGDYSTLNCIFSKRFQMKAGITGLAQVNGRNDLPWDKKIQFDNEYIDLFKKYGIFIDIWIVVLTIVNVFSQSSIYEVPKHVSDDPERDAKIEEARIIALAHDKNMEITNEK
jgi:lipopolysaccharide/colanic/teichoic acid biosynthesis glycosyltransferase